MSSTGDETQQISQFTDVTGTNPERARFYLEASGWDVQLAIASFFEADQSDQDESHSTPPPNLLSELNPGFNPPQAIPSEPPKPAAAKPITLPRTGPTTLDSLRQQQEEDSSDEDDRGEAFFAGGSITSGQQVLGPPKKKKDEYINDLLEKAREHGATSEDPTAATKPPGSFGGAGYKLGDMTSGAAPLPAMNSRSTESEPREVRLSLWSTGFTIDNGELRLYTDPNNMEFLNAIKRDEIPRELVRSHPGQEVHMALEDRRHEQYVPPKVVPTPFSGQGHMLGSIAPTVVTSTPSLTERDRSNNEEIARSQINLTETEPMTNIQFRLADGTRLVGRFNHGHRISDLHNFINTARPQFGSTNYVLTLFPNRELTDMEVTIKDANVLSSALIQKIKSSA